jgi:hypothetical protein
MPDDKLSSRTFDEDILEIFKSSIVYCEELYFISQGSISGSKAYDKGL